LQRRALVFHVAPRHCEARLLAAQLKIAARQLGCDRDLSIAQPRFRALDLCAPGFDVTAYPAEEIELPEGIEACIVKALGERLAGRAVDRRESLLGVAPRCSDGRSEVELRLVPLGTCLHEITEGDAQIVIRLERLIDQARERRVGKLRPEASGHICTRVRTL